MQDTLKDRQNKNDVPDSEKAMLLLSVG